MQMDTPTRRPFLVDVPGIALQISGAIVEQLNEREGEELGGQQIARGKLDAAEDALYDVVELFVLALGRDEDNALLVAEREHPPDDRFARVGRGEDPAPGGSPAVVSPASEASVLGRGEALTVAEHGGAGIEQALGTRDGQRVGHQGEAGADVVARRGAHDVLATWELCPVMRQGEAVADVGAVLNGAASPRARGRARGRDRGYPGTGGDVEITRSGTSTSVLGRLR